MKSLDTDRLVEPWRWLHVSSHPGMQFFVEAAMNCSSMQILHYVMYVDEQLTLTCVCTLGILTMTQSLSLSQVKIGSPKCLIDPNPNAKTNP